MPRRQELWTTAQCAAYGNVEPKDWRDYVSRRGAPDAVAREPGRNGQNLYPAKAVRAWWDSRPGSGWWGPHQPRKGN